MHNRLDVLSAELRRCQQELRFLGMKQTPSESNSKLIISTGDISDVDGFFALAEYAKTDADVLFIMNYPNYLQTDLDTDVQCVDGLGYFYDVNTYLARSETFIRSKFAADSENAKLFELYLQRFREYRESMSTAGKNQIMKRALTDLAFNMAHMVWRESEGNPTKLFFCVGGINSVNPFTASALKNELFVYRGVTQNLTRVRELKEGNIIDWNGVPVSEAKHDHEDIPIGKAKHDVRKFVNAYQELYIDFNGSMAFFDTEWASCLTEALNKKAVKGVFVAGGVFSDEKAKTMPSMPGMLNRLSCATMNQLYHPCNTFRFFDLMQTFNANVVVVTNNQVLDMETYLDDTKKTKTDVGWKSFLNSNKISSDFMVSLANAYYNSIYSPPRKPFDFYTAQALVAVLNGKCLITQKRTMHFNSMYGTVIVGKLQSTWKTAMQEYINGIDIKLNEEDEDFVKTKKKNFEKEIELLKTLSCSSITVSIPEMKLSRPSYKLEISTVGNRNVYPYEEWFLRKFGSVIPGDNNIAGVPIYFNRETDMKNLEKIIQWSPFSDWVAKTRSQFFLSCIVIQSVDMFGPRIGFVKFKADVLDRDGLEIPSIVFMRGGSVGILVIIECEGKSYTILTNQARVPIGGNLLEIPAGMLDGSGNFGFVAAKELKEETGIVMNQAALVDLTENMYEGKYPGIYPSAGGCDEFIRIFLFKTSMPKAKLRELEGRETGEKHEGEKIKIKVIPLENLAKTAPDMKALSALALYEQYTRMNAKKEGPRGIPDPDDDWRKY